MLIIDCHAHITSPDETRYPPNARPLRVPDGTGSIEDLRRISLANGVKAVRPVQTVSFYDYDNRYLCDAVKANPDWTAGVCTLEPDDPRSPGLMKEYVRDFGVRTLRSTPGDRRTTFDHDGVRSLWKACAEAGATVDIFLMRLEWVEGAEKILREFPGMTVGFDHCLDLKPGPLYEKTLAEVLRLSRYRNLYAKVDFISTGTETGYPGSDLHDAALKIIDAYGPERCVWGSNFPNILWTPKLTYAQHLGIFTRELPLSESARAQVLGETARRLWFPDL
ncbi:MAG: amidohydrolase [Candidatus Latescibacteria bacterium]|nr:amidohydrolase [Candidatus Latescibacterota bacterium]